VRPSVETLSVVYADTSLFCRTDEVLTWLGLYRLLDFFDARLRIVTDVEREMLGHARGDFPGFARLQNTPMQGEFLRAPAERLSPEQAGQVMRIAGQWTATPGAGPNEHFGEVATVLVAAAQGAAVIIDDGKGQELARRRDLPLYTTQDVAIAMAASGALTNDDGARLWDSVFVGSGGRTAFDKALAAARG
jgi:hypothetical protein